MKPQSYPSLVGRSVSHSFLERAQSYTSTLLSKYLFQMFPLLFGRGARVGIAEPYSGLNIEKQLTRSKSPADGAIAAGMTDGLLGQTDEKFNFDG